MKTTADIVAALVEEAHGLTPGDKHGTNDGLLIDAIGEALERLELYAKIYGKVAEALDYGLTHPLK